MSKLLEVIELRGIMQGIIVTIFIVDILKIRRIDISFDNDSLHVNHYQKVPCKLLNFNFVIYISLTFTVPWFGMRIT